MRKNELHPFIISETNYNEKWLSFFAYEMNQHNLVVFELVDLQYSWLYKFKDYLILPSVIKGLVEGLFRSLYVSIFYLIFWQIMFNGLFYHLGIPVTSIFPTVMIIPVVILYYISFLIFIYFITYGLYRKLLIYIKTKDIVSLSLQNIKKGFFKGIFIGTIMASIYVLLGGLFSIFYPLRTLGFFLFLYFDTIASVLTFITLGMSLTPLYAIIDSIENSYSFIQINRPYQRFQASAKFLYFSILQHLLLRFRLYVKGLLPYKLVHFLNDMTKNHLMESDGATWRFRHRILQDYFAEQWEKIYIKPEEKAKQ